MADTGWVFPTVVEQNDALGTEWTTPDNIKADDAAVAEITLGLFAGSKGLEAITYAFAIPAGATIDGVEVEMIKYTGEIVLG